MSSLIDVHYDLTAYDFRRILADAALFADHDFPTFNAVHLESTGTHLVAAATDRFTLGASATPYSGDPWEALIGLEHVKLIQQFVRPHRRYDGTAVTLTVSPKGQILTVEARQQELKFRTMNGSDFPKWRKLLPTEEEIRSAVVDGVPPRFGMNPAYLSRMARVGKPDRGRATWFLRGGKKPLCCVIGDFVGLVMPTVPVEMESGFDMPEWITK